MTARRSSAGTYDRIYATVRRIPRGRVATYGQVASLSGLPGRARQVGYALAALAPATAIPWQRVVNAAGAISLRPFDGGISQRLLLEREGVRFTGDRISLERYLWRPRR
ncbi:MAG TPA: MGMT family protein [Gemmatimonadaceae bacterium]|nr:MGMT family protein [Gemmatimonadaceae bacterium]